MEDTQKVRKYVEIIHTAAKESAKVVSRLKEFYRYRDEGEVFTPVVINDVVLQAISLTQPRWKDQALADGVNIDNPHGDEQRADGAGNESSCAR